jgi:hypothetical protein
MQLSLIVGEQDPPATVLRSSDATVAGLESALKKRGSSEGAAGKRATRHRREAKDGAVAEGQTTPLCSWLSRGAPACNHFRAAVKRIGSSAWAELVTTSTPICPHRLIHLHMAPRAEWETGGSRAENGDDLLPPFCKLGDQVYFFICLPAMFCQLEVGFKVGLHRTSNDGMQTTAHLQPSQLSRQTRLSACMSECSKTPPPPRAHPSPVIFPAVPFAPGMPAGSSTGDAELPGPTGEIFT